jgi:predicted nucleic acid-binding protein
MIAASLIDTNVLVYRFDARYPEKQRIARDVLQRGIKDDSVRIPHQALIEFVSAVTRTRVGTDSLLSADEARHEVEELMTLFPILYPNAAIVRSALLAAAAYRLSWFDAHLWAYAEHYGLEEIVSEDFQHGRLYGSVRVRNPFRRT